MIKYLKKYCDILGPSGMEDEVREAIIADIKDSGCEYETDPLGNLTVFKKGKKRRDKKTNKRSWIYRKRKKNRLQYSI